MSPKKGSHLQNRKMQDEAGRADVEAASVPEGIAEIIHEGGDTRQQIFSVDQTALYWSTMLSGTLIARREQSVSRFKAAGDRLIPVRG